LGLLERAAEAAVVARPIAAKLRKAVKAGTLDKQPADDLVERALKAGVISASEKTALELANSTRNRAIQVDWFDVDTYKELR
jgi:acyl-CoA dehydrogenase